MATRSTLARAEAIVLHDFGLERRSLHDQKSPNAQRARKALCCIYRDFGKTVPETAAALSLSENTVYTAVKQGGHDQPIWLKEAVRRAVENDPTPGMDPEGVPAKDSDILSIARDRKSVFWSGGAIVRRDRKGRVIVGGRDAPIAQYLRINRWSRRRVRGGMKW